MAARVVAAAELGPGDTVVEVGPGRGALTRHLAGRVGRLILVEVDAGLAALLRDRYDGDGSVEVMEADARRLDPAQIAGLAPREYKAVGNLPYYAATPIIRAFLESACPPRLMVAMVQREVAREIAAAPGGMGLLSIAVQLYALPRKVCDVPPRAFAPPPKVHSSVVRLDVLDRPPIDLDSTEGFFTMVRAGFSAPRKQLRNSLANGLRALATEVEGLLGEAGIDGTRRPATLSIPEWGRLYRAWAARSDASAEADE